MMQSRWDFNPFLGHTLWNAVPPKTIEEAYLFKNFSRVGYRLHISFSGLLYVFVQKQAPPKIAWSNIMFSTKIAMFKGTRYASFSDISEI
jgi:hypothetical protein